MQTKFFTIISLFLFVFIVNISNALCQDESTALNSHYVVDHSAKANKDIINDDIDGKNMGVRILELIIKHNINQRYQKIYPEELEDMLDRKGR